MENKKPETAKIDTTKTTEQITQGFLELSKTLRYQKQLETLYGSSMARLCSDMGISETTKREVFAGNTQDKKIIFGLVLSNTELVNNAKSNFIQALNKISTETE